MTVERTIFEQAAAEYDALRPGYPDAAWDLLEPLAGRDVLDLAAGTGKATRRLAARGARVVAADLGAAMLRELRARTPAAPAVLARAEALPFAASSLDLVTCATAWHWVDPTLGSAEVLRVLRPGGRLALLWNVEHPSDEEWAKFQHVLLEHAGTIGTGPHGRDAEDDLHRNGFRRTEHHSIDWSREVTVDERVRVLGTHSAILDLGERWPPLRERLRAGLRERCAGGRLTIRYCTYLVLAEAP